MTKLSFKGHDEMENVLKPPTGKCAMVADTGEQSN